MNTQSIKYLSLVYTFEYIRRQTYLLRSYILNIIDVAPKSSDLIIKILEIMQN